MTRRADELRPDDDSVTLDAWWHHHHGNRGNYQFWLTGSPGPDVWEYLEVTDRVRPGTAVLNIGVGFGHCTRELSRRGCRVQVLDISRDALAKVADCVEASWIPDQLHELPSDHFDLAISNLVTQHMFDDSLRQQLKHVVRSLKSDGVFAMQFAYSLIPGGSDLAQPPLDSAKTGTVCRTLGYMDALVAEAGGQLVWAKKIGVYPSYRMGWYAVHIARPERPCAPPPSLGVRAAIRRRLTHGWWRLASLPRRSFAAD